MVFIQLYFGVMNTIPLMVKRIPLPKGQELTDEEFKSVCNRVLLLLGVSCDGEINEFMSDLDELIVDSVYKLELKRPKKSIMRDNMYNVDMEKCFKRVMTNTIVGVAQENIFHLIMDTVYHIKGIDESKMTDEEYDEFLKSSDTELYQEIQDNLKEFQASFDKFAKENGVQIVSKKDLEHLPAKFFIGQIFIVNTNLLAVKHCLFFQSAAFEIFNGFEIFFHFISNRCVRWLSLSFL